MDTAIFFCLYRVRTDRNTKRILALFDPQTPKKNDKIVLNFFLGGGGLGAREALQIFVEISLQKRLVRAG